MPYLAFDSFHEAGSGEPPHRLMARPLASLVQAQAFHAELTKRGVAPLVVSTDELASGPFPELACAVRMDEQQLEGQSSPNSLSCCGSKISKKAVLRSLRP